MHELFMWWEKDMFSQKNILITGGSSGLGLALAKAFAKEGANLILIARNKNKLNQAQEEIQSLMPSCRVNVYSLDVSDEEATFISLQRIMKNQENKLDYLINSAGILREGYFEELTNSDFSDVMAVNYFGLLNITRAALPYLRESKGHLVNVASIAGLTGVFGYTPYCAAKHALVGLSEALRYELKPQGIHVHLICPGEFDSPMVDILNETRTPENRVHTLTVPKSSIETIVEEALKGIRKGQFFIVPGKVTSIFAALIRLLPRATRWMSDKTIAKVYVGPK